MAGTWSVTLFPSSGTLTSKTLQQDDTLQVGRMNPRRAWVTAVLKALYDANTGCSKLVRLQASKFNGLLAAACADLGFAKVTAHALRHGGPSCDAIEMTVSDAEIARHGRWLSVASVQRYRKPGRYLRVLATLTAAELRAAKAAEAWLAAHLPALLRATAAPPAPTQRRRR